MPNNLRYMLVGTKPDGTRISLGDHPRLDKAQEILDLYREHLVDYRSIDIEEYAITASEADRARKRLRGPCVNCGSLTGYRTRGLCWSCYAKPEVRRRFPAKTKQVYHA
jgi:hypothetical protein